MTLRGFGRNKARTWYNYRPLNSKDWLALAVIAVVVILALYKRNVDTAIWYPFA